MGSWPLSKCNLLSRASSFRCDCKINCLREPGMRFRVQPMSTTNIASQLRLMAEKPDPYAELKAAHKAGKVIQTKVKLPGYDWGDEPSPRFDGTADYRVKPDAPPFQLPPPPPGMQWHREDGWTAEDLPQGYRPHVLGERDFAGDGARISGSWRKVVCTGGVGSQVSHDHRRTARPLTFTHEGRTWTWHRPGDPMPCDGARLAPATAPSHSS